MAHLAIQHLDDGLIAALTARGAYNGRTASEEARAILREAVDRPLEGRLGDRLHALSARHGGAELDLPSRTGTPRTPALANPPRLPESMT